MSEIVMNYLKLEQETIDAYCLVFGDLEFNRHFDKYIFYTIWVGTIVTNGVTCNVYKYGISESGAVCMADHCAAFGPNTQIVYAQPVSNRIFAKTQVKRYLNKNNALMLDCHHDLKNNHQSEIFATRPDFKLQDILIKFREICEDETDPKPVQCIDKSLSDVINYLNSKYNNLNKMHQDVCREIAELRAKLMTETAKHAAAEARASVYENILNKKFNMVIDKTKNAQN